MDQPNYLLINTKNRNDYYNTSSSNFRIYLDRSINIKKYIKLHYLSLARTNYLITDKNNKIRIIFLNDNSRINIILPNQIYTPLQLIDTISILCNNINGLNASYNNQTFKITFSCNVDFQIDFTLSEFYKILNLQPKIYNSIDKSITSNIIFFNYPLYLNLVIKNISINKMINSNIYSNEHHFIISVGSSVNFGELIQYKSNENDIKLPVNDININFLDVMLLDDQNRLFDNNNVDYFFIIEFQ